MPEIVPLEPRLLCTRCAPELLDFETTESLPDPDVVFGQSRAVDALRLATEITAPGYNAFVLGEPGSHRHNAVRRMLESLVASRPTPGDWCYVNNFDQPNNPRALQLPPGRGAQLRDDMEQFVSEVGQAINAGFDSEQYRTRAEAIHDEFKQREEGSLRDLGDTATQQSVALVRTPQGFAFLPMKGDETLDPEAFAGLPEGERERITKSSESLREQLHKLLQQFPRWRREMQARLRELNRETLELSVGHLIEELQERHRDLPTVVNFLRDVLHDIVEVGQELREQAAKGNTTEGGISAQRYQVNLLVDQDARNDAPLEFEDHPTYPNLVGRVDHIATMGTLITNFTLIKAGALHRANGGFLLLDAEKVLTQPYAWEGLKRALKSGQIRIESLAQVYGWIGALPLEPEPIPLDVKLVLFGQRIHYYLLKQLDPEFAELFKIAADFEDSVERSADNTRDFLRTVAALGRGARLRPLRASAAARLVEHAARLAGDAGRLSTRTRDIADLLHESNHVAKTAGRERIERDDVEQALAARIRRADRLRDTIHDAVLRDTLLIETAGSQVGQINGLAVIDLGDFAFGRPMRITATARPGEGGVADIERKAELGGAIHTKGVMILSAFLTARYAMAHPLSLAASVVFEQSYGPVEGDSASLAELCALLSALSDAPIRQSFAVTGSVNQHGKVQAIGGVNEKIEGFFDICKARGLTGDQGVLIPQANVQHLMLREEVVEAARAGLFHVYAVHHVDEAISLLTGAAAGIAGAEGTWPEGSINQRIDARLARFAAICSPLRERRSLSKTRAEPRKSGQEPDSKLN
ncbi:Lon protease family protein [Azoarcus sp. KH32C]|uniref:Lon protease family protein n=1 Tax=Azoarcus sp. KH32C TaxID=748247 RepID=UPI0002386161|nr:ATP-binding protein [Azoarcus sp. KH32C]BAL25098.1 putative ATP-dependent protease [Azoarcus sp. KH32C]